MAGTGGRETVLVFGGGRWGEGMGSGAASARSRSGVQERGRRRRAGLSVQAPGLAGAARREGAAAKVHTARLCRCARARSRVVGARELTIVPRLSLSRTRRSLFSTVVARLPRLGSGAGGDGSGIGFGGEGREQMSGEGRARREGEVQTLCRCAHVARSLSRAFSSVAHKRAPRRR